MPDTPELSERGSLGYFWPVRDGEWDLDAEPLRGVLRLDGPWATIEALDEDVEELAGSGGASPLEAVIASLTHDTVLVVEAVNDGYQRNYFGHRASVLRFRGRTVITKVPIDQLRSCRLRAIDAHYLGLGEWAGISALETELEFDADNRAQSYSARVGLTSERRHAIDGRRTLTVSAAWTTSGSDDERTITAPVAIGCEVRRPIEPWPLVSSMFAVQRLLSFCLGGFVAPVDGHATVDREGPGERPDPRPHMWNGGLMVPGPGVPEAPVKQAWWPFSLEDMGGVAGLARWVRLAEAHPRAVSPVVDWCTLGPSTPHLSLMEVSAGIEYWVSVHRRRAQWAQKTKGGSPALSLAARVGRPFADFVGDPEVWARELTRSYNEHKHDPWSDQDPWVLNDLAVSGRYLLAAALLDHVAGSKAPSRALLGHHRIRELRRRVREHVAGC